MKLKAISIMARFYIILSGLLLFVLILSAAGLLKLIVSLAGIEITVILLFLAAGFYLVLTMNKLVLNRLSSIEKSLDLSQSEGDLTQRLPVNKLDEIGRFSRQFNIFLSKIHNIIVKLKNITMAGNEIGEKLESSSTEISASIEEMSASMNSMKNNGIKLDDHVKSVKTDIDEIKSKIHTVVDHIEEQSKSVTESASVIRNMLSSIVEISTLSESKKEIIQSMNQQILDSEKNMKSSMDSIHNIAKSADTIQEFISIIDGVADQTNILAMNAAIEAAHAGEYGKGFSIVASEIRVLSETTGENSRNIASNLNQIVSLIYEASDMIQKTGLSIKTMTDGIQGLAGSMNEIITGLGKVSTETTEISGSLNKLITVTDDVKASSRGIMDKAEKIDSSMNDLTLISAQNADSISETTAGLADTINSIGYVSTMGIENAENISVIEENIKRFKIIDTSKLKSSDGQPLIIWNQKTKKIPPKPDHPEKYPEEDERHWYDHEYAGFGVKKINIPESMADGSFGKKMIWVRPGEHPYYSAEERGMKKIADAYGIEVSTLSGNWTEDAQKKLIRTAIHEKPDFMVVTPINSTTSTAWFKEINENGIPVTACTSSPSQEAFQYITAFTGADTWGQTRLLARMMADMMDNEGGYCIVQHTVGNSLYYGRTYAVITELKKIAPKMICLDKQSTNLEAEKTNLLVQEWIKKYGKEMKGIVIGDAGDPLVGTMNAVRNSGRKDIISVTTGNCKLSLDCIEEGLLHGIAWQSAEGDGALPVEIAIDWFNGLEIQSIKYLPNFIITKETFKNYYPPQW